MNLFNQRVLAVHAGVLDFEEVSDGHGIIIGMTTIPHTIMEDMTSIITQNSVENEKSQSHYNCIMLYYFTSFWFTDTIVITLIFPARHCIKYVPFHNFYYSALQSLIYYD